MFQGYQHTKKKLLHCNSICWGVFGTHRMQHELKLENTFTGTQCKETVEIKNRKICGCQKHKNAKKKRKKNEQKCTG